MLESIQIRNFQSLRNVDIELGKLTVIVGPSSTGKSAITRAIKAVASNRLDSDYITQGTKRASVSVKTDSGTVTIERDSGGSSAYKVIANGGKVSIYSKLNRQVPTEVTEILGIAPSTKEVESINFAGQFDAPYLLKDGASSVARILGELTNVSTIFDAVREANRKVKNASGVLNLRKKDLDEVVSQIADYTSVGEAAKTITEAESRIAQCQDLDRAIKSLSSLIDGLAAASDARLQTFIDYEVPSLDLAQLAQQRLDRFTKILKETILSSKEISVARASEVSAQSDILSAEDDLHQALTDIGQCPLCQREM
jgi:DNA repair protein SbcC/Rad50